MTMKRITTLALAIIALCASAQNTEVLQVWPNGTPNNSGLVDTEKGNGGWIEQTTEAVLTVFHPQNPNGTAIVCCPGGGYWGVAINHEGMDMAQWMNAMGITYCVLKYRMPNRVKEVPSSDAWRAIEIVREHAAEWHIDANKVGIMGASAGGHLAATVANLYPSAKARPDFQILFYPVITMEKGVTHQGSRDFLLGEDASDELALKYSMETRVTANTPQAFIMVSADDDVVPVENSLRYASALNEAHVPFALHIYPTGGHGWGYGDHFIYKRAWTGELELWLRTRIF